MSVRRPRRMILCLPAIALTAGCDEDEHERTADVAVEAADRQARQNEEMARLNRAIAEGSQRLAESEAEARRDFLALQGDLQEQQAEIGRQRDRLEEDREALAERRRRESLLVVVLSRLGELALCALPLVLCWYLLHALRGTDHDPAVQEILIEEIAAEEPRLLPRPPSPLALPPEPAPPDDSPQLPGHDPEE